MGEKKNSSMNHIATEPDDGALRGTVRSLEDALEATRCIRRLMRARLYNADNNTGTDDDPVDAVVPEAGDLVLGSDAVLRRTGGVSLSLAPGDAVYVEDGAAFTGALFLRLARGTDQGLLLRVPRVSFPVMPMYAWWIRGDHIVGMRDPDGRHIANVSPIATWEVPASPTLTLRMRGVGTDATPAALPKLIWPLRPALPYIVAPSMGRFEQAEGSDPLWCPLASNGGFTAAMVVVPMGIDVSVLNLADSDSGGANRLDVSIVRAGAANAPVITVAAAGKTTRTVQSPATLRTRISAVVISVTPQRCFFFVAQRGLESEATVDITNGDTPVPLFDASTRLTLFHNKQTTANSVGSFLDAMLWYEPLSDAKVVAVARYLFRTRC